MTIKSVLGVTLFLLGVVVIVGIAAPYCCAATCPNQTPHEQACFEGPFPQCPTTGDATLCVGTIAEPSDGNFGCKCKNDFQCLPGLSADNVVCMTVYGCKVQVGECKKDAADKQQETKRIKNKEVACPKS